MFVDEVSGGLQYSPQESLMCLVWKLSEFRGNASITTYDEGND